ncbi:MAG TPA: NB-ARC domain-containing protein, partial [Ktedonobacteraceae bacterium]|nr:NB-ARC domain-containing protein [Ktedonobacteraceae bacterium]
MKSTGTGTFAAMVRERLRSVGYFQKDLASAIGLHPKVLSRKLGNNEDAHLTVQEVRHIIKKLAEWQAITSREEALQLLELARVEPRNLSAQDWQTSPLDQLAERGELPDASTGVTRQHNLPLSLTCLIGREEAVEQLRHILTRDEVRLLTLIGPGGSGKTRLALEVACELVSAFAQGVWFVSLAAVRDAALVPQSIMQALNIKPPPALPALQSLSTYLQDKQLLLLLDNFEHLPDAAEVVGELLATVPGVKLLVTSRSVLHVYGEREFAVPPL